MPDLIVINSVGGVGPNFTLVVDTSIGVLVGDHITALLDGLPVNDSGVFRVVGVPDGTTVDVVDDLRSPGTYGLPAVGSAQFYTPTDSLKLSQSVEEGPHWGPLGRRDNRIIDGIAGGGWIRIADLLGQAEGVISNKTWQDAGNTVLQTCTSSTFDIRVSVEASYPLVTVDGNAVQLPKVGDIYAGLVDITIAGAQDVAATVTNADGSVGATDTVAVAIDLPPEILTLSFTAGYPGGQSELKAGDAFQLTGTTDVPANAVQISDFGACSSSLEVFTLGTNFTVTGTIADRGTTIQALAARLSARNAAGAFGGARDTNELGGSTDGVDLINLNNLFPTVGWGSPTYPGIQEALKNAESATVPITLADLDTVLFDSPNGDLLVTNPTTIETPKTVSRIAGNYNVLVDNLRATANRAANDATTVDQRVINIAHVATQITVSPATARVRSGAGVGNDTVISIIADQDLLNAPSLDPAASRGTFQGGGFVGGPITWTRSLRVADAENPANGSSNTWLNLVATNLAGLVTSVVTTGPTYVVGGFTTRTLNYAAFTANSTETVPLATETKLTAGSFSNGNAAVRQPFGTADTSDIGKEGWFAPTAASGVVNLRMLHTPSVAANSGGLTLSVVEEAV